MSAFKPESVLKRAEELVVVNRKNDALELLHDSITNRHRPWSKVMEEIMIKLVGLCVEMRRLPALKEAFWPYKVICQQVAVTSFELVSNTLLEQIEKQTEQARAKAAAAATAASIEDLESPEVVGVDESRESSGVIAWLSFQWQIYRMLLDATKNHPKFLALYQQIGQQAQKFCVVNQRKSELRKLCEMIRSHLVYTERTIANDAAAIASGAITEATKHISLDLSSPQTLQTLLEQRLSLFDTAIEMELFPDAFKLTDDIRALLAKSKSIPNTNILLAYYSKLSQLFFNVNNYLIHAYSMNAYWTLSRIVSNQSAENIQEEASAAVLAALSAPVLPIRPEDSFDPDTQREKNRRIAKSLGFQPNPSRSALLSIISKETLSFAHPQTRELYSILETEFSPLILQSKASQLLNSLSEKSPKKLGCYSKSINQLIKLRVLQQCSKLYSTLNLNLLSKLCGTNNFLDLEMQILTFANKKLVNFTIDHISNTIVFPRSEVGKADSIRSGLTSLLHCLSGIAPRVLGSEQQTTPSSKTARNSAFERALQVEEQERQLILSRHDLIDAKHKRRELYLQALKQKQIADELAAQEAARKKEATSSPTPNVPTSGNVPPAGISWAKALIKGTTTTTTTSETATAAAQPGMIAGPPALTPKQVEEMTRLAEQSERKVHQLAKDADHLERAKRRLELSLLVKREETLKLDEKKAYDAYVQNALENSKKQHEQNLKDKEAANRMRDDRDAYFRLVMESRKVALEKQKAEYLVRVEEMRKKWEEEQRIAKEKAERERIERERLEKERIEKERIEKEAIEKARAEKERIEKEEAERLRNEKEIREEKLRKLEEEAAKTNPSPSQKEAPKTPTGNYVPPYRKATPERERERERERDSGERDLEGSWRRSDDRYDDRERRNEYPRSYQQSPSTTSSRSPSSSSGGVYRPPGARFGTSSQQSQSHGSSYQRTQDDRKDERREEGNKQNTTTPTTFDDDGFTTVSSGSRRKK